MLRYIFIYCLFAISPICLKRFGGGSSGNRKTSGGEYPHSTGYSGNSNPVHTYPRSTGLSGNTAGHRSSGYVPKTEVHHHYHYNPPQHISYGSGQHPVYRQAPPTYVYEYRNSGSRFDTLLTGLALYNLGRMSSNHHSSYYDSGRGEYRGQSGEICKLGISKSNGEYEETRIDCKLMSSFIWEANSKPKTVVTTKEVTTTVNVTQIGSTQNGTNNSNNSLVTRTVQNTTVVDALTVKGPSVQVTPGMQCFMIRISRDTSVLKKKVECGLLQEYARSSMHYRNTCNTILPVSIVYIIFLTYLFN